LPQITKWNTEYYVQGSGIGGGGETG